jgi:hypothetical protein
MGRLSSPIQYTAAAATSSGRMRRPAGAKTFGTFRYQSGGLPCLSWTRFSPSVSTQSGLIWLTRTPCSRWRVSPRLRVRVMSAPLLAL